MFWRLVKFTFLFWVITWIMYFIGAILFYTIQALFVGGITPSIM